MNVRDIHYGAMSHVVSGRITTPKLELRLGGDERRRVNGWDPGFTRGDPFPAYPSAWKPKVKNEMEMAHNIFPWVKPKYTVRTPKERRRMAASRAKVFNLHPQFLYANAKSQ